VEKKSLLIEGFPVELKNQLKIQALKENMTLKAFIVKVLGEYVGWKE
jgi:hypothetical protein